MITRFFRINSRHFFYTQTFGVRRTGRRTRCITKVSFTAFRHADKRGEGRTYRHRNGRICAERLSINFGGGACKPRRFCLVFRYSWVEGYFKVDSGGGFAAFFGFEVYDPFESFFQHIVFGFGGRK